MPRQKVKVEKILNKASQQVTLSKRRRGLFKKATELSVMCDAEVAVIVFSAANKNTFYANPSMDEVLAKWNAHPENDNPAQENPPVDVDVEEQYELLKKNYAEEELRVRQLEGKELGNLSIEELNRLEETMLNSLNRLKAKQKEQYLQFQTKPQIPVNAFIEGKDLLNQQMEKQITHDQQRMDSDSVHATRVHPKDRHDDILSLWLGPPLE